jgi:hypothetical protein
MATGQSKMKTIVASAVVCALLFCANAFASDMFRFGNRLLEVGDPVTKLIDLAGEPLYREPIQNEFGAFQGERWQYKIEGAVVTFVIRDAKVKHIDQAPRD